MEDKQKDTKSGRPGGNPHEGHRQRMRVRYAEEGLDGFAPHEVLEMLLYSSITRGNTNPIAHDLLERCGTMEAVLQGETGVPGVGEKSLEMLRETGDRIDTLFAETFSGSRIWKSQLYTAAVHSLRRAPDGVFLMIVSRDGTFQEMKTVAGYSPEVLLKTLCPMLTAEQLCHIAFVSNEKEEADLRKRFGKSGLGWILTLTQDWQPVWNP